MTEQTLRVGQSHTDFATPEDVVTASHLQHEEKRSILQQWRDHAAAGGAKDSPDLGTRLARALAFLDTESGKHGVTHDQGFYTSVADLKE